MGFIDPLIAIIVTIGFLIVLLYKRVNLGIALNATAFLLALLAVDLAMIIPVAVKTTTDPLTISVCAATFGIMLLSELYKETGMIKRLSESISRLIDNPKIVLCILPAIIGLLPVGGGALVSAPLVDSEADRLKMKQDKKAYVNLWFRHTIFPIYPLGPVMIATAVLTGVSISSIILRQIPVVLVMVLVGYIIGFERFLQSKKKRQSPAAKKADFRRFFLSFSPILITILIDVFLNLVGFNTVLSGFDVVVAVLIGIAIFVAMTKVEAHAVFTKSHSRVGESGESLPLHTAHYF